MDVLKPDGAFMGALVGGESLRELRDVLFHTELQTRGGISNRTSPLATVASLGNVLSDCRFSLPTVDVDRIQVGYPDLDALRTHLRNMGEATALKERADPFTSEEWKVASDMYAEKYPQDDEEGGIGSHLLECRYLHYASLLTLFSVATFDVIYWIGWKPHASQPQPLERGSAETSLVESLAGGEKSYVNEG